MLKMMEINLNFLRHKINKELEIIYKKLYLTKDLFKLISGLMR